MDYEALINHEIITFDKQAYPLKNIYRMLNFINGINGYVKGETLIFVINSTILIKYWGL